MDWSHRTAVVTMDDQSRRPWSSQAFATSQLAEVASASAALVDRVLAQIADIQGSSPTTLQAQLADRTWTCEVIKPANSAESVLGSGTAAETVTRGPRSEPPSANPTTKSLGNHDLCRSHL